MSLNEALAALRVPPDFTYPKPESDTSVAFVHRHLDNGDLYFVNNRIARPENIEARFRVVGKVPELWHADSGRTEPVSFRIESERTVVPLKLDPHDAVFVVFLQDTDQHNLSVPEVSRRKLGTVSGPWRVSFQSDRGAPQNSTFSELVSWTTRSEHGIRYFSGTANYETSLQLPPAWIAKGAREELDLGVVKNLAEVLVNGRSAGIVWKPPFRIGRNRPVASRCQSPRHPGNQSLAQPSDRR